jgi:hypothetical protein
MTNLKSQRTLPRENGRLSLKTKGLVEESKEEAKLQKNRGQLLSRR